MIAKQFLVALLIVVCSAMIVGLGAHMTATTTAKTVRQSEILLDAENDLRTALASLEDVRGDIIALQGTPDCKSRYYVSFAFLTSNRMMTCGSRIIHCDGRIETDDDLVRLRNYISGTISRPALLLGWQRLSLEPAL